MIGCAVVYFFGLSFHFGVGFVFLPLMFCFVPFVRFVSCFCLYNQWVSFCLVRSVCLFRYSFWFNWIFLLRILLCLASFCCMQCRLSDLFYPAEVSSVEIRLLVFFLFFVEVSTPG